MLIENTTTVSLSVSLEEQNLCLIFFKYLQQELQEDRNNAEDDVLELRGVINTLQEHIRGITEDLVEAEEDVQLLQDSTETPKEGIFRKFVHVFIYS